MSNHEATLPAFDLDDCPEHARPTVVRLAELMTVRATPFVVLADDNTVLFRFRSWSDVSPLVEVVFSTKRLRQVVKTDRPDHMYWLSEQHGQDSSCWHLQIPLDACEAFAQALELRWS